MNGEETQVTGRIARTLRVALPLAALMALVAAGPALAAKPLKLKQAAASASVVGSFNIASATATCPKATQAVAGGYVTSVPNIPNHWLNVHESQRIGTRQWRVSGVEYFPAPAADSLVAFVYCEALAAKVKAAAATIPLTTTPHGTTSVLALCPSGHTVVSGGFLGPAANPANSAYISRSTLGLNGWVVDATNLMGAPGAVTAFAYCAKVGKVRQRSANAAVVGPANSVRTATTPACPKPTAARGGGFATSTPVGGLQATALVYESRRAGASWTSAATASGNTTSRTLVSTALCR
jgi:hypothetical protein